MLKILHSELSLQNLNKHYVASLRMHIWSDEKVIIIDYIFGKYDEQTATLKQISADARNQYVKCLNEFAGENDTGPLASREDLHTVLTLLKPSDFRSEHYANGYRRAVLDAQSIVSQLFDEKEKS